jgi:translation initiation factor 2 gamma subunit (eIF-2gamma)
MHPRIKKKYFTNLLVLRIGVADDSNTKEVEFLPKQNVIKEIRSLVDVFPKPYVLRVFDIDKPGVEVYNKFKGVFDIFHDE